MRGLAFSKKLAMMFVWVTTIVTLATLFLCYKCIVLDYQGSLPFLSALIGLQQVSVGYVCGSYMHKSKAENTAGGIVYENSMINNKIVSEFDTPMEYSEKAGDNNDGLIDCA